MISSRINFPNKKNATCAYSTKSDRESLHKTSLTNNGAYRKIAGTFRSIISLYDSEGKNNAPT